MRLVRVDLLVPFNPFVMGGDYGYELLSLCSLYVENRWEFSVCPTKAVDGNCSLRNDPHKVTKSG